MSSNECREENKGAIFAIGVHNTNEENEEESLEEEKVNEESWEVIRDEEDEVGLGRGRGRGDGRGGIDRWVEEDEEDWKESKGKWDYEVEENEGRGDRRVAEIEKWLADGIAVEHEILMRGEMRSIGRGRKPIVRIQWRDVRLLEK
jgi:hypothetical protein